MAEDPKPVMSRGVYLPVLGGWAYKIRSSLRSAAAPLRHLSTRAEPTLGSPQRPRAGFPQTTR